MDRKVRQGRENRPVTTSYYFLWWATAIWLIILAVHLVNANFPFFGMDWLFGPPKSPHAIINFFLKYIKLFIIVALATFFREVAHEIFGVQEDEVRATRFIRRWLTFYFMFLAFCEIIGHPAVIPPTVSETTVTLGVLLVVKWGVRKTRKWMNLSVGAVPTEKQKKTQSFLRDLIKALLRSRGK